MSEKTREAGREMRVARDRVKLALDNFLNGRYRETLTILDNAADSIRAAKAALVAHGPSADERSE